MISVFSWWSIRTRPKKYSKKARSNQKTDIYGGTNTIRKAQHLVASYHHRRAPPSSLPELDRRPTAKHRGSLVGARPAGGWGAAGRSSNSSSSSSSSSERDSRSWSEHKIGDLFRISSKSFNLVRRIFVLTQQFVLKYKCAYKLILVIKSALYFKTYWSQRGTFRALVSP